ncbi:MAG: hypothetical protein NT034_01220, partial [Candidatus Magasanikbacteria bacterium]|nr:hypothetical protein [Candidatus Magasanikbacteria bacterium]
KGQRKYLRRKLPQERQLAYERAQQERERVRQIELQKIADRNKQMASRLTFSVPSFAPVKTAPVPVQPVRPAYWTCKANVQSGYFSGICDELNFSNTCTYCGAARPAA